MRDKYGLTPKQRAWADAFVELGSERAADRKAGYRARMGDQNRENPAIKAYIEKKLGKTQEKGAASADEVVLFLSRVMRGEVKDQFGLDASLQDRIKAGQELMKRYAVADQRQQGTLQRLDGLLMAFQTAIAEGPTETVTAAIEAPTDTE